MPPGPKPKDPKTRQRTNKAPTRAILYLNAEPEDVMSLPDDRVWHVMTQAWWQSVWESPMAKEYLPADVPGLFRLAVLIDLFWAKPTPSLAAEIRLEQQPYGLTPLDRRRLEWEVRRVEREEAKPKPKVVAGRRSDPRSVLAS